MFKKHDSFLRLCGKSLKGRELQLQGLLRHVQLDLLKSPFLISDIRHFLNVSPNSFCADRQFLSNGFHRNPVVPTNQIKNAWINTVLTDTLTDTLRNTLRDTLTDTVIQVRQNNRELGSVRAERRFLSFLIVDLDLVGTDNLPEAAASSLHVTFEIRRCVIYCEHTHKR